MIDKSTWLQVGQERRTRDDYGQWKVIDELETGMFLCENIATRAQCKFTPNGSYLSDGREHCNDLITIVEQLPEPEIVWRNVYVDNAVSKQTHDTKEAADNTATSIGLHTRTALQRCELRVLETIPVNAMPEERG